MDTTIQIDTFTRFTQVSRETIISLKKYENILIRANKNLNLVGKSTLKDIWERLAEYFRKWGIFCQPLPSSLDNITSETHKEMLAEGVIEIAPIGFMRGRTLNNAFVVVDEAQNCTYTQIKMLLTRLGWHSTMVVTGDPAQSDLLPELSGLKTAADKLEALNDVAVVRLQAEDVVRHPLVAQMLDTL